MSYKEATKQPERRAEGMEVRELVLRPDVEPVAEGQVQPEADFYIPYNEVAPGLYEDETVYTLDTGESIALSCRGKRDPLGAGMRFRGWARVIEADGSTMRDKHGAEMELSFSWPCEPAMFDYIDDPVGSGEGKIGREIMLLMLGEEPTMVPIKGGDPDAPPAEVAEDSGDWERHPHKAPPGTVLDPGATEAPLIGWSLEMRKNASIRFALKMFQRSSPQFNVGDLLAKE